ncbi:ABC transporter ATP-binding protein [Leisingera sp. HS039]|uniref:dipeptide ABC transporter ATP-binding protein n=1 Tax=unclassified Leisingera TaxID=2614906 RepID=UPI001070CC42|nr:MULTISPECIES: ABC transporter ATP-binding protein [unclassified Leisingera]MBQ4826713.1 ABC transporter ATP-binding protein [Leisingera sp. HS039]QBR35310.1 ABC transporter ATP-binding protein [Leisingera sp. NJS201]
MTNTLLKVVDLAVRFGPIQAVKWVSFTLQKGRTLGIVGESGSGKSTLLWALTRLLPDAATLNSGEVWFDGDDLLRQPPARMRALRGSRISYISQDPMTSLAPGLTIGQQMTDLLYREPWPKREKWQRAIDALDWVSLPDPAARMNMYPHELSGGQRQRVSIAMALMLGPDLVLADEPTTALDPTLEVEILELLRRLQQETGCAVVFVTHHLGVVASLCDDVLVMKSGEIREAGPVQSVFTEPQDDYTKALLRCDPAQIDTPTRRLPTMNEALKQPVGIVQGRAGRIETDAEPVLNVRNLSVSFTRAGILPPTLGGWREIIQAVQDVSFDIRRGETLALIGESGSGKTTVARSIMGLVRPGAGSITLNGTELTAADAAGWNQAREQVAMMFQDPAGSLSPRVTIAEQVVEPLAVHGRRSEATRARAIDLLTQAGLDASFADRYPHEMSGGQARRAGVARALALSPSLIVADEPTAGLDVSVQGEVVNLLNALQEQMGLSILLITHNMSVVRHAADRMIVMLKGELVETGPTAQLFAGARHEYTRRLIAASFHALPDQQSPNQERKLHAVE